MEPISNQRISWEEYALRIATDASLRSEDPYVKVGACGLDENNYVLGTGYNGLARSKNVDISFWEDRDLRRKYMIHAEANLLSLFKRGKCKLLACTLLPCQACATLIASHGVKKVVYKEMYHRDNSAIDIFKFYDIECVNITYE
jgi:dCMP deaminase